MPETYQISDEEFLANVRALHTTKSAQIRALAAAGWSRSKIADALAIRYQHAWNVLAEAEKVMKQINDSGALKQVAALQNSGVLKEIEALQRSGALQQHASEMYAMANVKGNLAYKFAEEIEEAVKLSAGAASNTSSVSETASTPVCDSLYLETALKNARTADKEPLNLSFNASLREAAKRLNLNLTDLLERRVIEVLKQEAMARWKDENREAIESSNRFVEKHGLWSDGLRQF